MPRKAKLRLVSEVLRKAIIDSGLPHLTIERQADVKRQSVRRFVKRERSLNLGSADALAQFFDLELVQRTPKRQNPAGPRKGR